MLWFRFGDEKVDRVEGRLCIEGSGWVEQVIIAHRCSPLIKYAILVVGSKHFSLHCWGGNVAHAINP